MVGREDVMFAPPRTAQGADGGSSDFYSLHCCKFWLISHFLDKAIHPFVRIRIVPMRGMIDAIHFVGVFRLLLVRKGSYLMQSPRLSMVVRRECLMGTLLDEFANPTRYMGVELICRFVVNSMFRISSPFLDSGRTNSKCALLFDAASSVYTTRN
jgi:hypothetical protein